LAKLRSKGNNNELTFLKQTFSGNGDAGLLFLAQGHKNEDAVLRFYTIFDTHHK
jgi:hypothetical protein